MPRFLPSKFAALCVSLLLVTALPAQDVQYGLAKAYHDAFEGDITAYGLVYRKNEFTAAHNLFPEGALLQVKRLDNNKTVQVTVIDKGPWIQGYVIDLSRAAADLLGISGNTSAEVEVTLLRMPSAKAKTAPKTAAKTQEKPVTYDKVPEAPKQAPTPVKLPPGTAEKTIPTNVSPSTGETAPVAKRDPGKTSVYKITQVTETALVFGVQIASVSNPENVFEEVKRLQKDNISDVFVVVDKNELLDETSYKIVLGAFPDVEKAGQYRIALRKKYARMKGCFVVNY